MSNGKLSGINIHKKKYKGSRNDYWNPILEIHDFDIEDEMGYKLKVDTGDFPTYSTEHKLKMLRSSGKIRMSIIVFTHNSKSITF